MKRTKQPEPRTKSLQPVAEVQLAKVKGGATAIEYGLIAAVTTPPTD